MIGAQSGAIAGAKVGRNDPCPCGSGKKFKHCCGNKSAGAAPPEGPSGAPMSPSAVQQRIQALAQAAKKAFDSERRIDALPFLAELARLQPRSAEAHYNLGVCCLRCGRLAQAAESLEQAVKLQPGFIPALIGLAEAYAGSGDNAQAAQLYRKVSRKVDDPTARRRYSVMTLAMDGMLDEAMSAFRSLPAPVQDGNFRYFLGDQFLLRGRFDEAADMFAAAADAVPNAFERLTSTRRITEADGPLIDRMRARLEQPGLDVDSRASLHFGLGKIFDDLGDYAEAIRHYDAANGLKAKLTQTHMNRAHLAEANNRIIARFSAEAMETVARTHARPPRAGDDLPVFIVGMFRSGTTLVEQILSAHPAVAAGGELPFWKMRRRKWLAPPGELPDAAALARAADDYLGLLRKIGPQALRVTDKEPRNFDHLEFIRAALPQARIIHCRRHPIDTCLSIYFANLHAQNAYAFDRANLVFIYQEYERLMAHWRDVLPPDRYTEIQYEALVADPEPETRRLIAFLGLEWDDACLAPPRNNRAVATSSAWQARQPVYKTSVERWRRYEPWLGALSALMPAHDGTPGSEGEASPRDS
jgi:tetratricopeptide (TPR) repeat protein